MRTYEAKKKKIGNVLCHFDKFPLRVEANNLVSLSLSWSEHEPSGQVNDQVPGMIVRWIVFGKNHPG